MEKLLDLSLGQLLWSSAGVVVLLSLFIEITPVKVNPLSAVAKWFGKKANGELHNEVANLRKDVADIRGDISRQQAEACRCRIIRFGDDLRIGQRHSQDHFQQVLLDIVNYDLYCEAHPDFCNGVTKLTSKLIEDTYESCVKNNDFL